MRMCFKLCMPIILMALLTMIFVQMQMDRRQWNPAHIKAAASIQVIRHFDKAGESVFGQGELVRDPGSSEWMFIGQQRESRVLHHDIAKQEIEDIGYRVDGSTACYPLSPACNKVKKFKGTISRTIAVLY